MPRAKKRTSERGFFKRSDLVCRINREQRVSGSKFVLRPALPTPTEMQLHGPFRGEGGSAKRCADMRISREGRGRGKIKGRRNAICLGANGIRAQISLEWASEKADF
ncbi:hypothetical protein CDAR_615731 [Caerostris darwini]|uniref:Ribosomal protein S14 n=1 Tax=Caerostris darwini TaxID=1538125 RepID=A0AAV4RWA0_9ARAC|nr:hypothetical protein CDAR_615731 [Caerostris darwini]